MIKRFLEWIRIKEKLHTGDYTYPNVKEGEIWWASIGDNIGGEINGKGKDFTRPVYIYHKFSNDFYLIIPTSSKMKIGSWFVTIKQKQQEVSLYMHQLRVIDSRRLSTKIYEVGDLDKLRIYYTFLTLYGSKMNHPGAEHRGINH